MRRDGQHTVKHGKLHSTQHTVTRGMNTLGTSVCERTAP